VPTKLDELLFSIDPARTIEKTQASADEAINSFSAPAMIDQWDSFHECVAQFLCHLEATVINLPRPMNDFLDHYRSRGIHLLRSLYGPNGEKAAFEIARTGNEGGFYGVLKALATHAARQYNQSEILARINNYWHNLSTEEQLAAPTEYLDKFSHLLPSELTEGNAGRIRANFPKVLEKHPDLIQTTRSVGR